jgi:hypothetical protein
MACWMDVGWMLDGRWMMLDDDSTGNWELQGASGSARGFQGGAAGRPGGGSGNPCSIEILAEGGSQ